METSNANDGSIDQTMGSQFLSREAAVKRLKISKATLYRHIRKGYLRTRPVGNTIEVSVKDIEQLERSEKVGIPFPVNKLTIANLAATVRRLERDLETVVRILNIRHEKLNLTETELVHLYKVVDQYSKKGWSPHVEEPLAGYFMRLRYDQLETLSTKIKDPQPWKPFFRLASTMAKSPYNKELEDLLEKGKENIDSLSKLWVEFHGGSEKRFEALVRDGAKPIKKLLRYLVKQQTPPKSPYQTT